MYAFYVSFYVIYIFFLHRSEKEGGHGLPETHITITTTTTTSCFLHFFHKKCKRDIKSVKMLDCLCNDII